MTQREKTLKEKGYHYYRSCDTRAEAKKVAEGFRGIGDKATVLEASQNGIYHYEIWVKRGVAST